MSVPIAYICGQADAIRAKIDAKLIELNVGPDLDESGLEAAQKGTLTRWRNELIKLEQQIITLHAAEEARRQEQKEAELQKRLEMERATLMQFEHKPGLVSGGDKNVAKAEPAGNLKLLKSDMDQQPELTPRLDVAIFVRKMGVVYKSHVEGEPSLLKTFLMMVEQKMHTSYRQTFQARDASVTVDTWAEMRDYLLRTHKSNSTIFQELGQFNELQLEKGEKLTDFGARIETVGAECKIVIAAKFKEMCKREMNVDDLFDMLYSDTFIKSLQSNARYSAYYNDIVRDLDTCYKVSDIAARASTMAKRKVDTETVGSSSTALMASSPGSLESRMESLAKTMESVVSKVFMAKGVKDAQSTNKSADANKQKSSPSWRFLSWDKKVKDPEFIKWSGERDCKFGDKCARDKCTFKHPTSGGGARGGGAQGGNTSSSYYTNLQVDLSNLH